MCLSKLFLLAGLIASGTAFALDNETPSPNARQLVRDLKEAYANVPGFLATYQATKSDSKDTAEVIIGFDRASSTTAGVLTAMQDGESRVVSRFWTDDNRRIFLDMGGGLSRIDVPEIPKPLISLMKAMRDDGADPVVDVSPVPSASLGEQNIDFGIGIRSGNPVPEWYECLSRATLVTSDAESATFQCKELGEVRVDRKTGLILSQEMKNDIGTIRRFKLKNLTRDPGAPALRETGPARDPQNAKPVPPDIFRKRLFHSAFQSIIDDFPDDPEAVRKFKAALEKTTPDFFAYFATRFDAGEPMILSDAKWKEMFDGIEKSIRQTWAEIEGEKRKLPPGITSLDDFLRDPKYVDKVRHGFLKGSMESTQAVPLCLTTIAGKPFDADTETGRTVRDAVSNTIVHAYLAAMFEHAKGKHWPPRPKESR